MGRELFDRVDIIDKTYLQPRPGSSIDEVLLFAWKISIEGGGRRVELRHNSTLIIMDSRQDV